MFRATATRSLRVSVVRNRAARRGYSVDQPNEPPKSTTNTFLYVALGAAALAGGYWYYSHPDEAAALEKKAKAEEEEIKKKAKELQESAEARVRRCGNRVRPKLSRPRRAQSLW